MRVFVQLEKGVDIVVGAHCTTDRAAAVHLWCAASSTVTYVSATCVFLFGVEMQGRAQGSPCACCFFFACSQCCDVFAGLRLRTPHL